MLSEQPVCQEKIFLLIYYHSTSYIAIKNYRMRLIAAKTVPAMQDPDEAHCKRTLCASFAKCHDPRYRGAAVADHSKFDSIMCSSTG